MPALTLRGRYLMREYWSDSSLFMKLTAEQRELYVGLWMLADDKGWLPRDIPGVAAALYRYEDRDPREARVKKGLARLRELGKVQSLRCGCLHLPAVERYPRAGKKSDEHSHAHDVHIRSKRPNGRRTDLNALLQTDLNPSPVPSSSRSDPSRAREEIKKDEESEFERKVPRPAAIAAKGQH